LFIAMAPKKNAAKAKAKAAAGSGQEWRIPNLLSTRSCTRS
jgi:hypothetical protein